MYTGTVCAYSEFADPSLDRTICSHCGAEFGYDEVLCMSGLRRKQVICCVRMPSNIAVVLMPAFF